MWKLVTAGTTPAPSGEAHLHLTSLNDFQGRQTWEFDPEAGSPEERAKVEQLRADFTKYRLVQKHSADELLRLQSASRIAAKPCSPPSTPLPSGIASPQRVEEHLKGAISFYECLQQEDGHWPGDYGGPMFLMPGLLITLYTTGSLDQIFSDAHKQEAIRYFRNHQNKDGGFGLHIEGGSTMFGTVLQ